MKFSLDNQHFFENRIRKWFKILEHFTVYYFLTVILKSLGNFSFHSWSVSSLSVYFHRDFFLVIAQLMFASDHNNFFY